MGGEWEGGRRQKREEEGIRGEGRRWDFKSWFTSPMSEILKNTLIAEPI